LPVRSTRASRLPRVGSSLCNTGQCSKKAWKRLARS
jgi:hypothetical protein